MESDSKNNSERMRELRERRIRIAEEKEKAEKRTRYGETVVAKFNAATGLELSLGDFNQEGNLPIEFARRPDFRDCPGLVAAHTSELRIREIASCCDAITGPMCGIVGFDEYTFVGTARVESTSLVALLHAAKSLHDSVLFCPEGYRSIVLLDHYKVRGMPRDVDFSLVVQGVRLEEKLAGCFANIIQLGR